MEDNSKIKDEKMKTAFNLYLDRLEHSSYDEDKIDAIREICRMILIYPNIVKPFQFKVIFKQLYQLEDRVNLYKVINIILRDLPGNKEDLFSSDIINYILEGDFYVSSEFIQNLTFLDITDLLIKNDKCVGYLLKLGKSNFLGIIKKFIGISVEFEEALCLRGLLFSLGENFKSGKNRGENIEIIKKLINRSDIGLHIFINNSLYKNYTYLEDFELFNILLKYPNKKIQSYLGNSDKLVKLSACINNYEFLYRLSLGNYQISECVYSTINMSDLVSCVDRSVYAGNLITMLVRNNIATNVDPGNSYITRIVLSLEGKDTHLIDRPVLDVISEVNHLCYIIFTLEDILCIEDNLMMLFKKFDFYSSKNITEYQLLIFLYRIHNVSIKLSIYEIMTVMKLLRKNLICNEIFSESITEILISFVNEQIKTLSLAGMEDKESIFPVEDKNNQNIEKDSTITDDNKSTTVTNDQSSLNESTGLLDISSLENLNRGFKTLYKYFSREDNNNNNEEEDS